MSSTSAFLESDHRELDVLLSAVFESLDAKNSEAIFAAADLFWARLAVHIRAEHLHLFPALSNARPERKDLSEILTQLRKDHDHFMVEIARAIGSLRSSYESGNVDQTLESVGRVFNDVKSRLEQHDQTEETLIYPLAGELDGETAEVLRKRVIAEIGKMPPRFQ